MVRYIHPFLIFLYFCFGAVVLPAQSDANANDIHLLQEIDRKIWKEYMLDHNTEPLREYSTDDYIFVASIGVLEYREQVLTTAANLDIESVRIKYDDVVLQNDTAVLIGTHEVKGKVLGHEIPGLMRFISVFTKVEDGWKLLAQSLTPVVDPREQ